MAYNGSGTFLINTAGQPVVAGTVISSTTFNALTADLATGLSTVITKDGQTTVTANIPMASFKFTGLGVGSAATDSATLSQVQSTVTKLLAGVSGTDTVTATASPTLAAYAAGQMFYFVAAGDNTTSVTLNIDALGAKAVTRDGSVALAAADIKSGEVVVVVYDGTRFQVVSQLNSAGDARFANVSIASSLYVGGVSTFVGNAGFSANVSIASALSVGGVAAITGATTIGGNLTLNGGTANGVAYLNGSKVVTSGTALVFDGTNFGLGTNTLTYTFNVAAPTARANYTSTTGTNTVWQNHANTGGNFYIGIENSAGTAFGTTAYSSVLWSTGSTPIVFATSGAEQMRLTSTGLGIGTTSPAYKLDVQGATGTTVSGTYETSASGSSIALSRLRTTGTGLGYWDIRTGNTASGLTGALDFFDNIASATRLTIDSSGNLGIGTTSPVARLDVFKTSNDTVSRTNAVGAFGDYASLGAGLLMQQTLSSPYGFTLQAANAANSVQFPLLLNPSGGNVGIGTSSPAYKLDVSGNISVSGVSAGTRFIGTLNEVSAYTGALTLQAGGGSTGFGGGVVMYGHSHATYPGGVWIGRSSGSGGPIMFGDGGIGPGTEQMRLTSGGDLLVGTTTVAVQSNNSIIINIGGGNIVQNHTNGTSSGANYTIFGYNTSTIGSITQSGTTAVLYNVTSDQRLKENIVDAPEFGSVIDSIQVRSFNWKTDNTHQRAGFVAQELVTVAPEAVHQPTDTEEMMAVDYSKLVPMLVKEVQSLRKRVAELESK